MIALRCKVCRCQGAAYRLPTKVQVRCACEGKAVDAATETEAKREWNRQQMLEAGAKWKCYQRNKVR